MFEALLQPHERNRKIGVNHPYFDFKTNNNQGFSRINKHSIYVIKVSKV